MRGGGDQREKGGVEDEATSQHGQKDTKEIVVRTSQQKKE